MRAIWRRAPEAKSKPDRPMTTKSSHENSGGRFDTFETWKQYQAVAMHFNDLLMRLRSASLAAVGAFAAIAGVVVKTDVAPDLRWGTLAGVFLLLACFWVAMWVLDFQYYKSTSHWRC